MTPTAPARRGPQGRYGRDRRARLTGGLAIVAVVIAVIVAVIVFVLIRADRLTVDANVRSYHIDSPHAVTVTFELAGHDRSVVCTVRARDRAGAEVGRAQVTVPAGVTQQTYQLTTTGPAVDGELAGCADAPTG